MYEAILAVVENWWFALLLGFGLGILVSLVIVARDPQIVRLSDGLVVTEKRYIDRMHALSERMMAKLKDLGEDV